MRYSVIMLTMAGREPSMRTALQKVRAGAATPVGDYEIVVVNNGGSALAARYPSSRSLWLDGLEPVTVIDRPTNEGVCARNYGIAAARGDFIIQIDDDVLVAPGFDEVLLAPYSDPQVGASGQHGFYQDQSWGVLIDDRRRPAPGQLADLIMGFCWSWRNDERFRYDWHFSPFWHEESDLQLEIKAAGYRLMVTREVAQHRSLHDWNETKADGPITGETIALRNFYKLVDKWKDREVRFEGPFVGLAGPAPGRSPPRP